MKVPHIQILYVLLQERLGLAAEHGYFLRYQASQDWQVQGGGHADLGWKDMVIPILEVSGLQIAFTTPKSKANPTHPLGCTPCVLLMSSNAMALLSLTYNATCCRGRP